MSEINDVNRQIIEEFRANGGKVAMFEGANVLILHSTGAKSGDERLAPLVYQADGDRMVIFASKAGAPSHPDWYRNLVANPSATVEVGSETVSVSARTAEGDERERLWTKQMEMAPGFAEYEQKAAGRIIPVVILDRAG